MQRNLVYCWFSIAFILLSCEGHEASKKFMKGLLIGTILGRGQNFPGAIQGGIAMTPMAFSVPVPQAAPQSIQPIQPIQQIRPIQAVPFNIAQGQMAFANPLMNQMAFNAAFAPGAGGGGGGGGGYGGYGGWNQQPQQPNPQQPMPQQAFFFTG